MNFKNIFCIGKGTDEAFEELKNNFKGRQEGKENKELLQEYRFFEFQVQPENADEFKQWLSDHSWSDENINFSMVKKMFNILTRSTGYKIFSPPDKKSRFKTQDDKEELIVKIPMLIYLSAERDLNKDLQKYN